ncbi:MAG TPA: DUF2393 family protein [Candidatus Sulfotelmatobacter sp.]|nr:DUF2393 family protein [Candidatus Sulfotelmatobacter sp.]
MNSLGQSTPGVEERDSSRVIIMVAVVGVIALMLGLAFLLREPPKPLKAIPTYAANIHFSDFKMSAAENFVGSTVSYIDGTVTNSGDKTVTHVVVDVVFKDEVGQLAQDEPNVPLRVLRTSGPYPEAVDLSVSPLAPGQSQPFRLTFDHISAQWNRQYPEMRVTDVAVK